ncbi:methyl-accepting chemotaxis protein [Chromohalobacter canadensis]|uniref:Methyl-accepting chemotaxis protein n=1 Tax=Chromohalobacter canadensis TaxID=141389 RepID=A0A285VTQ5_9GAMM|nr:methyl-accepting chemotaxis protein [Chromohalobacter canadensis]SOC57439.1 methyl-accepting chemotaxis protein [Chromohalobacter canadensis]
MKKSLSLRAMLIGLFVAAVLGALIPAAAGFLSNQRLIEAQSLFTDEILPQQAASGDMSDALTRYRQRQSDLLAADSEAAFDDVVDQAEADKAFTAGRDRLAALIGDDNQALFETLESDYADLRQADTALEEVRREDVALTASMRARIDEMQDKIGEVLTDAESMAGRATLEDVREQRALIGRVQSMQDDGMSMVPMSMLDTLTEQRANIAGLSSDVQMLVAQLADQGRQLMQVDSHDALVDLRYNQIAQQISRIQQALASIEGAVGATPAQQESAGQLEEVVTELNELMLTGDNAVYALRDRQLGLRERSQQALAGVSQAMDGMGESLERVEAYAAERADDAANQAAATAQAGRVLQLVVLLIVIVILAAVGWRVMTRVLKPIGEMRRQMESISGAAGQTGDLSMRLKVRHGDEIGHTAQAFNQMMVTFERLIARIRDGAESVASSSRQIASGNQDLAQRTDEQSSSLAETAASLEEITATVKQTADYAHQARDMSHGVGQRAREAGDVGDRTHTAMQEIRESSDKISTIVEAIDSIAFQTNLLALNASVEAARAGEHGRGFAVVADEVRRLASRSADEAEQIRHLVKDSVAKVGEGANLVEETGGHLREIVDSVDKVSQFVSEIAEATQEQSTGIDQINQAIAQLDQVTQQNASLVQDASSASMSLDERANDMHVLVGRFKVSNAAYEEDDDTDDSASPKALPAT